MNDISHVEFDKEVIFNFLKQKLEKRLSDLEALRASNDRTVDYIRKKSIFTVNNWT